MRSWSKVISAISRPAALVCLAVALGGPIWAQCQMCKETASFQKAEAIEALNNGIILLAIPPAAIVGGLVFLTYRHRNGYRVNVPGKRD